MHVFVINLERSQDRRAFMCAQLDALAIDYSFFQGVDAANGALAGVSRYDRRQAIRATGETLSPAEQGCFASHYLLWQRCVTLDRAITVMEDDVVVGAGFPTALQLADEHILQHRFLRLAGLWSRPSTRLASLPGNHELVRFHKGPVGTQCYAISPAGAQILIQHADVWIDAVDRYIDRFWSHRLASIAIRPFYITHAQDEETGPDSLIEKQRADRRRSLLRAMQHRWMRLRQRCLRIVFNLRHCIPHTSSTTKSKGE